MFAQTKASSHTTQVELPANKPFTRKLTAKGADGPVKWRLVSGELPPDLTLIDSGVIDGTPRVAQTTPFNFTLEAKDSSTPEPQTFRQDFEFKILGGISEITLDPFAGDIHEARKQAATVVSNPCTVFDDASNADTLAISVKNELSGAARDTLIFMEKNGDIPKNPIDNPDALISNTCPNAKWEAGDYLIIHLIRWASNGNDQKSNPEFERWFLYKNLSEQKPNWELQDAQDGTRIYGNKRVAVLLLHIDAKPTWDIKYTVSLKAKTPAPIQNVLDLAGIIMGNAKVAAGSTTAHLWGGRMLNVQDLPSDLIVQSNFVFVDDRSRVAKEGDDSKQTQQPQSYSKTYDNEGRYHWDVSVGIPLKSFKEVTYDVENQQVTAKTINRQNAYGFLNLFLNPNGVDTKGAEFYKTPHLMLGVPISGKPLDRPVVGLGIGFFKPKVKFNLFAGVVFNRVSEPQTLANGQTATQAQLQADLRTRRIRKFVFGINLPIKQFKDALSKK
jgi:hypothetical protein